MKKLILNFLILLPALGFAQEKWWFSNITPSVGLDNVLGGKTYISDINGDQWPDLVVISGTDYFNNELPLSVWINEDDGNGSRKFVDKTAFSDINANRDESRNGRRTTAIALADIDNDGDKDILAGIYFHRVESSVDNGDRTEVLLNDGNGKFTIKEDNGFEDMPRLNTQGISFLDFDKDGILDVFLANWSVDHTQNVFQHDALLRGNGDGSFTDYSFASGISNTEAEPLYGCNVGDWNNDGNIDIFTAPYCRTGGRLWSNQGNSTFVDVSENANYDAQLMAGDNGQALCMWAAYPCDYDNDEDLDLFFTMVHGGLGATEGRSTIVQNQGEANDFLLDWQIDLLPRDGPRPQHQADYEAAWTDFNNDGLMDLLVGQGSYPGNNGRVYLFMQKEDHTFEDITFELGLNVPSYVETSRVRTCDFDRDGDEDLILSTKSNNQIQVLRNDIGNYNNFIAFEISGPKGCNKDFVGGKVKLYHDGIVQTQEVYEGEGNAAGQNDLIVHFGLKQSTLVDSVVLILPNHSNEKWVLNQPEINKFHNLSDRSFVPISESYTTVYPNPVYEDYLQISTHEGNYTNVEFRVYDRMGRMVLLHQDEYKVKYALPLSGVEPGAYVVAVYFDGEYMESQKFLKF
ncbi:MAG: VCBS repeat-containing protein [Bacteroidia bacterium]|nr:VCBS repeat-containing protein [Bacteroidia bacterium]NNJ55154.1 T9SS type A sorting domain-containing protein [Bacteroidia bacterium]